MWWLLIAWGWQVLDPEQAVVCGDSAGGNLSAGLIVRLHRRQQQAGARLALASAASDSSCSLPRRLWPKAQVGPSIHPTRHDPQPHPPTSLLPVRLAAG